MRKMLVWRPFFFLVLMVALLSQGGFAQEPGKKEKEKKGTTKLHFHVTSATSNEPLRGAQVWVKSKEENEDFEDTVVTNAKGVASLPNVPHGKILVQVTLSGWKVFNKNYTLKDEELDISIELDPES